MGKPATSPPRLRFVILVAAVMALIALVPADVSSAAKNDAKSQREEVRKRKVQVASQIDALKATNTELQDALDTLDNNLRVETAAKEAAEKEVAQAAAEADAIRDQQAQTAAKIDALKTLMTNVAVDSYARPQVENQLFAMAAGDINEALRKQALLDIINNKNRDLAEQLRAAKADLEQLQAARDQALARAEAARAEVADRVSKVAEAQQQQQKILDSVETRIDRLLVEADSLASKDKALSEQIRKETEAAIAAAQRAAQRRSGGSTRAPINLPQSGELRSVRGIVVHVSIADKLEAMLAAADKAGINLSGGGYRDPAGQIAVRRSNCGTSDYDVYQKPSFSCRPPTARPGTSNHERGLAIDFTSNGSILTRGSAAFGWLSANAARYGFYNLPSEPWHWSVDGN
jgi:LAS superfamily LD-carboxypeptidase LdcB